MPIKTVLPPLAPVRATVCHTIPPKIAALPTLRKAAPKDLAKTPEQRLVLRDARHLALIDRRQQRRDAPPDMPAYIRSLFIS